MSRMFSYPQWLVVQLLVFVSSTLMRCIFEQDRFLYKLRDEISTRMSWMFSRNRVLTCVVVLRNKTGGPFQIDTNLVGSLYFVFS